MGGGGGGGGGWIGGREGWGGGSYKNQDVQGNEMTELITQERWGWGGGGEIPCRGQFRRLTSFRQERRSADFSRLPFVKRALRISGRGDVLLLSQGPLMFRFGHSGCSSSQRSSSG